jgi:copper chaperone CopZ
MIFNNGVDMKCEFCGVAITETYNGTIHQLNGKAMCGKCFDELENPINEVVGSKNESPLGVEAVSTSVKEEPISNEKEAINEVEDNLF